MKFTEKDNVSFYVRSMGKLLKITAAFESIEEANKYMESHKDEGMIAEKGNTIFLANLYDQGLKVID